jgi:Holliday junction resolvase RusA-like endonuclease
MTLLRLSFALRVTPAGKERPRVTRFGTFMPKAYEAWREMVRWQVRSQVPAWALPRLPMLGRVCFSAIFLSPHGEMKPDLDNAIGALWDAIQVPPRRMSKGKVPVMKGGGWGLILNDKQIKRIEATEVQVGPSRIAFTISEIV